MFVRLSKSSHLMVHLVWANKYLIVLGYMMNYLCYISIFNVCQSENDQTLYNFIALIMTSWIIKCKRNKLLSIGRVQQSYFSNALIMHIFINIIIVETNTISFWTGFLRGYLLICIVKSLSFYTFWKKKDILGYLINSLVTWFWLNHVKSLKKIERVSKLKKNSNSHYW